MIKTIGIIKETKNEWERRAPLIPKDVSKLLSNYPVNIIVQPSARRIYRDEEYQRVGAQLHDDLSHCDLILGIKEIKIKELLPGKAYMYFSHTMKGQSYNMPMLKKLLQLKCTLIDYEGIVDKRGKRLIFFSLQAGQAGIIDTLWAFGKRLAWEGIPSPFQKIKQSYHYDNLARVKNALQELAIEISIKGLPKAITPLVIGITGYGNASRGVQALLDLLPVSEIKPDDLQTLHKQKDKFEYTIFKVIFKEEDMVEPVNENEFFNLKNYYRHPEKYRTKFERYLPYLTILVNASFWDIEYPKHVTKESLKKIFSTGPETTLRVIGDISCDIEGGVECTIKATDPGKPIYTYDTDKDEAVDGFLKSGPVIMAIDNLPSELPLDASVYFSSLLRPLLPEIIKTDFSVPFDQLNLPESMKMAVVVHKGELTPEYHYLREFLR